MKPKQRELREIIRLNPDAFIVANAHRQFGKSTAMFAICAEYAIQNPRSIIKMGAPTIKQIKEILQVVEKTVLETCPPDLRPTYRKADGEFVFSNGSMIKMIGVDIDDGNRLRGSPAHLVVLDEAGFMSNLRGLVENIILPQFTQTNGRLIMISTPSTATAHDYIMHYIPKAQAGGKYWPLPITANPQFDLEAIERIAANYDVITPQGVPMLGSGWQAENFRREYLCEVFTATDLLVVPEWQKQKREDHTHNLVAEWAMPAHLKPICSADFGFKDHTGILFGWIDFEHDKLIVRDEIFENYMTPSDLSALILEKKAKHFNRFENKDFIWSADAPQLVTSEIRKQTGIAFVPAMKRDRDAGITNLRTLITKGKVIIHPECRNLIQQLDTGTWNKARTDMERTEHMGHLDLLDALIYMARIAPWAQNPTPPRKVPSEFDNFVPARQDTRTGFDKMLGRKTR